MTGFADVFDVYVGQYHKAGVAESQKKGAEVWLATCCYPMDHPNFFIEYPLLDIRVTPLDLLEVQGRRLRVLVAERLGRQLAEEGRANGRRSPGWPTASGSITATGISIYPGADLKPYSSIRFEALRDGFEDYEYLWTLRSLLKRAEAAGRRRPRGGRSAKAARTG